MVATGIIAMRRVKWMDNHDCNAYCRAGRHADVFFGGADDPDPAKTFGTPLAALGFHLVHLEPAKESRDEPDPTSYIDDTGRIRPCPQRAVGAYMPFLVVWEEVGR